MLLYHLGHSRWIQTGRSWSLTKAFSSSAVLVPLDDRSARTRTRRSRPRCSWCRRTPNAVRSTFHLSETFSYFSYTLRNDLVMGSRPHAADGGLFRVVLTVSQLFEALSRAAMLNPDPPEPGKAVAGRLLYRAWQEMWSRFIPDHGFLMCRIVGSLVQVRRRGTMT